MSFVLLCIVLPVSSLSTGSEQPRPLSTTIQVPYWVSCECNASVMLTFNLIYPNLLVPQVAHELALSASVSPSTSEDDGHPDVTVKEVDRLVTTTTSPLSLIRRVGSTTTLASTGRSASSGSHWHDMELSGRDSTPSGSRLLSPTDHDASKDPGCTASNGGECTCSEHWNEEAIQKSDIDDERVSLPTSRSFDRDGMTGSEPQWHSLSQSHAASTSGSSTPSPRPTQKVAPLRVAFVGDRKGFDGMKVRWKPVGCSGGRNVFNLLDDAGSTSRTLQAHWYHSNDDDLGILLW